MEHVFGGSHDDIEALSINSKRLEILKITDRFYQADVIMLTFPSLKCVLLLLLLFLKSSVALIFFYENYETLLEHQGFLSKH